MRIRTGICSSYIMRFVSDTKKDVVIRTDSGHHVLVCRTAWDVVCCINSS